MEVQLEYMMGTKSVLVMENQRVDRSVVQRVGMMVGMMASQSVEN